MKFKRLLPALPFIIAYMVLSIIVENNVIADYSIVTKVNRLGVYFIWITSLAVIVPKYNWKWYLFIGWLYLCFILNVINDSLDFGVNKFMEFEDHSTYKVMLFVMIGFDIVFCVIYKFKTMIDADKLKGEGDTSEI